MTYCTILIGGYGSPHRLYKTPSAALRAAQRHCQRHGQGVDVAWCKEPNNPKMWLARVTPETGTTLTEYWAAEAEAEAAAAPPGSSAGGGLEPIMRALGFRDDWRNYAKPKDTK